jgi:hypothetical protein
MTSEPWTEADDALLRAYCASLTPIDMSDVIARTNQRRFGCSISSAARLSGSWKRSASATAPAKRLSARSTSQAPSWSRC